jgi:hypothetical protein
MGHMNPERLSEILSQPFTYLTEGLQAFIYVSEDGKFILKTFKNLEQSKDQFKSWGLNPDDITGELIENSIKSYELAFDKLREETALVYIHVSSDPLPGQKLLLDNKEFDASDVQFLVQERVELVRDRIKRLMSASEANKVEDIIEQIMTFIGRVWEKGITEDTFNWDHNYGYTVTGKLAQIDVGTFWEGDKYLKEELQAKKLLDSISQRWLDENFPEFSDFYREKAKELYERFAP